jgi:hypothetical protein
MNRQRPRGEARIASPASRRCRCSLRAKKIAGESMAMIRGPRQIAPREELPIHANLVEKGALWVRARSQTARTRADCDRFSAMSETLETGWWMMKSDANCSPQFNSLIIRENTGNFVDFRLSGPICGLKILVFSRVFIEIPYSTEQGIILEDGVHPREWTGGSRDFDYCRAGL